MTHLPNDVEPRQLLPFSETTAGAMTLARRLSDLLRSATTVPTVFSLLVLGFLLLGCDSSPTESEPPSGEQKEVGVVVNSEDRTLTVFGVEDPSIGLRTIDLTIPDATPVGLSVREGIALVPMGVVPTAVVVDLDAGGIVQTIPLPSGSWATGSLFLTDSTALVANPGRGTVSRVNVLRGTAEPEVEVGTYPQAIVEAAGRIVVVNSELVNFVPARTGTLSILDPETLEVEAVIELSGENPGSAEIGPDGFLYVVNGGRFEEATGSLSVVDLDLMQEVAHHEGFGHFPSGLAIAGDGRVYVSSWSYGVVSWDPVVGSFHRGLDDPVEPGGIASASGLATDEAGRLYTLFPDCAQPARVIRLDPGYQVEVEIPVGICPAGLAFTMLGEG